MFETTLAERRAARQAAGASKSVPVVVLAGEAPPCLTGARAHYRTPSGQLVRYPSAYRRAYGRPVYWPSTRRIEVGASWLGRS